MTTTLKAADLIESVAAALQYISYYHPADYITHLARAYAREVGDVVGGVVVRDVLERGRYRLDEVGGFEGGRHGV